MTLQQRFEALAKDKFLGVPVEGFEAGGREQLRYLLRAGLNPSSKLVDLGCGVLRAGYWIIRFLDPGGYCGIEPHPERLRIGIEEILDPGTVALKRPRFHGNPDFDTSVFAEKFDFFLAYSIWTHSSKPQIQDHAGRIPARLQGSGYVPDHIFTGGLERQGLPGRQMVRNQPRVGRAGLHSP